MKHLISAEAIATVIHDQLRELIDYHTCRIYLLDDEGKTLIPLRYTDSTLPAGGVPVGRGFAEVRNTSSREFRKLAGSGIGST